MSVQRVREGRWRVVARVRVGEAIRHKQATFSGSKEEAKRRLEGFKRELRDGPQVAVRSLTAATTFGEVLHFYRDRKSYGTMASTFGKLDVDLGRLTHGQLRERFGDYLSILGSEECTTTGRVRKGSTLNRYLACARRAYTLAHRHGLVTESPLLAFDLEPEQPRDRVLSVDEEKRLLATLSNKGSYLYWPAYFSLRNPIRKGDLARLTWENLDELKPWIHFYPSKTKRKRPRETCLVFLDEALLGYFADLRRMHPDCPLLFPRIVDGHWLPLGCFKKHWATVLSEEEEGERKPGVVPKRKALFPDFVWHDLKHCAITWMLDNGYTERDLKNLGIQYTDTMIDRYYKADAGKVLKRFKGRREALFPGETAQGAPERDSVVIASKVVAA